MECPSVGDLFTQWKAGRVRMLTIMDKERSKFYSDLPTTAEVGMPVLCAATRGIAAPKERSPSDHEEAPGDLQEGHGD